MALQPGTKLGPYEVHSTLGAGGMGEVYRARDAKLNRDVALKVLPEAFAADAARMARFEREAQVLAALNHPNIAAIYGLEQNALAMELVEGQTLAERIAAGPIPVDEAVALARQIAEGLEAAHERGIVHRDLKPENVKITPAGTVKLLDFGLAKAAEEPTTGNAAMSPTLSLAMTQAGVILGTAAYMSPEQARGKPVDKRADIWAFGVVLYEMLAGRQLYGGGETVSDALAAVITKDPDWTALPKDTPPHLRRLLERCLRKDPRVRLRDIGEARVLLDEPFFADVSARRRRAWPSWAIAGALGVVLGAAGGIAWIATRPPPPRPLMRLNVELGQGAELSVVGPGGPPLAISPDGTRLALAVRSANGGQQLATRLLRGGAVTALQGTDGAHTPFFSPDGHWIGFFAERKLKKVSVEGGAAVMLCNAPNLVGASWGDDGNIVAALSGNGALVRIPSAGGHPEPLTQLKAGERTHRWPNVLPGSRGVLFTAHDAGGVNDDPRIEAVSLPSGERKIVHRGGSFARYLPSGHLIYQHKSTIFAAPFDLERLALTGTPVPVLQDVAVHPRGSGLFTVESGTFVYLTGTSATASWSIFWMQGSGAPKPLHDEPGQYLSPSISPDGKLLAVTVKGAQGEDIWVKDLERGTMSRLTFLAGENRFAVWTPDGTAIVFQSTDPEKPGLYWVRSDGSREAVRLLENPAAPWSFSPDKRLALTQTGATGTLDIFTAPMDLQGGQPRLGQHELFLGARFREVNAVFSPDGRWIAYQSNESGREEVYVRPFPGPGARVQISNGGGEDPRWSRPSRELFFQAIDGTIMVVPYSIRGDTLTAGQPRAWSQTRPLMFVADLSWDLAPDGNRVVALLGDQEAAQKPVMHVTMLLNFFDEVRRRMGASE